MNQDEKNRMCRYLQYLSNKRHIESRRLFLDYKRRLEKDIYLTQRQLEHLYPFIERDTDMSEKELSEYLTQFLPPEPQSPNTLEQFFE